MKALAVADLHLTDKQSDAYRFDFVEKELPDLLRQERAERLLILGDLTEGKDRHTGALVNRVVTALYDLGEVCPVTVLMGNHDYANEGEPFFAFSRHLPDVQFISKIKEQSDADGRCVFLPHSRDPDRDWRAFHFSDYLYVFAHQAFKDADSGFGYKLDGYPTDCFRNSLVFAGDIHKPQRVGPVHYIGAPYTIDFGDGDSPRILSIDGKKHDWIDVSALPQKKLVQDDGWINVNPGDLVRVRVKVDSMEGWQKIVDNVHEQARSFGAVIERVEPVLLQRAKRHSVKPVSGSSKASDSDLVRQFADRNRLSDGILDAGLDIVEGK